MSHLESGTSNKQQVQQAPTGIDSQDCRRLHESAAVTKMNALVEELGEARMK